MMRKALIAMLMLLLLPAVATAQKLYKWVDAAGNVSYHDRPPPEGAEFKVEEKDFNRRAGGDDAIGDATRRFPVVLYMVPKCAQCDIARAYLQKQNIPYSERNVEKNPALQKELEAKSGSVSVPTITVGTKVMTGYMESLLEGELREAGYFGRPDTGDSAAGGEAADGDVAPEPVDEPAE